MEQEIQEAKSLYYSYKQYFSDYLPALTKLGLKVVMALLVFVGGRKVIQWFVSFIKKSMERASVDKGVIQFIGSLLRIVLYILLVFSIATHFGVKESSIAALLGTAGVTVGLALQGGLANIAGGIMLLIFKPFQVGDYIIIAQQNGCEGTVYKIEICYTTLISIDNKHIVIPNGTLSGSIITNVTARDLRKLEIKVGISYDSDIKKAKAILEEILHNDEDTKDDQGMVVFVDELGESAVVMGLRVWVATEKYWPAKWRLNELIKEALICYTTLISIDNKHIVIPNGTLSGSIITNVTARDLRKLEIKVGISYDSDIKKAKAILEEILHNDEDTKDDQGMVVFVDELGESAVVMGLRVWVATEKYWPARWRLNELIKEAFDANGIEIPYNQLQVHVKKQI